MLAVLAFLSISLASDTEFLIIESPKSRFTKDWVIIVDTSDSMQSVSAKALRAFRTATSSPTDEFKFCAYVFNDFGMEKRSEWFEASIESFDAIEKWILNKKNAGVHSHGRVAIKKALQTQREELTIIIISDGGFTSSSKGHGFHSMRSTIDECQQYRANNGLGRAIIATIGIENRHYSALCPACCNHPGAEHNYALPDMWRTNKGYKLSNEKCQSFLREIGTKHNGGYFLVRAS